MTSAPPRLAVIGAGISGLICARRLRDAGWDVTVFEKSRGVGGRMATRRTDGGLQFDHGAQYFTVRDERFERSVKSWMLDAVVAPWEGRIVTLTDGRIEPKEKATPRFVGVPGMNAICKHLAADVDIQFRTRVAPPRHEQDIWRLDAEDGQPLGEFDCVITSAPAPQSADLLAAAPELQQRARATEMNGCWAVMLSFSKSLELPFDGAFVHGSPLSWIARSDTKPQRAGGQELWILHASPGWTGERLDQAPDQVLPLLVAAFWQATAAARRPTSFHAAHLWRYAIAPQPLEQPCLFDPRRRIGACGDWCSGPRVEGAYLSGVSLADQIRELNGR